MMEVVVITGAIRRAKFQSKHQQTNTQLLRGWMLFLSPNQQCQSTEGKSITLHRLAHPKLTLSLTVKAPGYPGKAKPLLSPQTRRQYPKEYTQVYLYNI